MTTDNNLMNLIPNAQNFEKPTKRIAQIRSIRRHGHDKANVTKIVAAKGVNAKTFTQIYWKVATTPLTEREETFKNLIKELP